MGHQSRYDEGPPPQQIFVLNLIQLNCSEAVLNTLDGKEVKIPLDFTDQNPFWEAASVGQTPAHEGLKLTVKDLGKLARHELGLDPITPLHISTRVVYDNEVLPIHRPLATLLEQRTELTMQAHRKCHYCNGPMTPMKNTPSVLGPFKNCFFCEDAPAWHHGYCCPHNQESLYCKGIPHAEKYRLTWKFPSLFGCQQTSTLMTGRGSP